VAHVLTRGELAAVTTKSRMTGPEPTPPVEHLVTALLQSFGQLALVVEHMYESAASAQSESVEPVPVVLHRLLADVLAPLADGADEAAMTTAAQVVCAATATIGAEVHLVTLPPTAACGRRMPPGARRARGRPH
jgi:hypothetical protein